MPISDSWIYDCDLIASLIARVWKYDGTDMSIREKFVSNPKAYLQEIGISIPDGIEVTVDQNIGSKCRIELEYERRGNGLLIIPLPPKPSAIERSEESLAIQLRAGVDRLDAVMRFGVP